MLYELTKEEKNQLSEISETYYMKPGISLLKKKIDLTDDKKTAWKNSFDCLHELLLSSKKNVDDLLEKRKDRGEIISIDQARKSIAGNAFSKLLEYVFIQNKVYNNIKPEIFITSKKSQVKDFDQIATICIDGETQKPDCDLIIYSLKSNNEINKCMILSLKTSLRERAGQTYKWKLLMEIATTENPIKEKYGISYNPKALPLVCFATVNFYSEIDNPQHRGMFKFFNKAFIAKNVDRDFISKLSKLPEFVNSAL
jgi:type II restriction enzyme